MSLQRQLKMISRDLLLKLPCKNLFDLPNLSKIVLHTSSEKNLIQPNHHLKGLMILELLSGQKAKQTRAHKSIAGFKTRKGNLLGCSVTLRGKKIYLFLDHFLMSLVPRSLEQNLQKLPKAHSKGLGQSSNSIVPSKLELDALQRACDLSGNISFGLNRFLLSPALEDQYIYLEGVDGFQLTLVLKRSRISLPKHLLTSLLLSSIRIPVKSLAK
jgi:ribosomal protein L5